jgi:diguanylate cyclase (GGDEF)-like protein/PAS domain S-box-containing protein
MFLSEKLLSSQQTTIVHSIWRLFLVAACPLLGLGLTLYWSWNQVIEHREAFLRTQIIERNLQMLGEDLSDAETAERGYLLTLDTSYLGPYVAAQGNVPRRLEVLSRLMIGSPGRSELERIRPLALAKLALLAKSVALAESGQEDEAMHILAGGSGRRLMDDFRAARQEAMDREHDLLTDLYARIGQRISRMALTFLLGGAAIIFALFFYTRRTVAELRKPVQDLIEGLNSIGTDKVRGLVEVSPATEIGRVGAAFNEMAYRLSVVEQAALIKSRQQLQQVTDRIPVLIAHLDLELRFSFVNKTYKDWYGLEPEALLDMSAHQFYGEPGFSKIAPHFQSARAGNVVTTDIDLVTSDRLRHCEVQLIPQRDERGEVVGLYLIQTDVTERRKAYLALRASESFLARTGAVAGVGGWEFDLRAKVMTWSDGTKRLFEVEQSFRPTFEATLGFYKPEAIPIIKKHFTDCVATAKPYDLELELVTAKGRSLWTRFTGAAEFEGGMAVRVVGAFQDITCRKTLERELAESNELMRVTLDSIGDGVITTDQAGNVVWLNPVAERLTGWSKDEARSKPLPDVFSISNTDTGQTTPYPITVCLQEGKSVGLQSHTTLHSRHGNEYGIEDSASAIRNAEGEILGAVLIFHDVSEQRRLNAQMNHRATHDALTGLVNRAEFENRLTRLLEAATREGGGHVLMYIDLDEFKVINDACGHAAGDQLLRQVSVLLQGAVRGRDTVARLGGDEFGVILEMCPLEQGREIAQKICEQMDLYRFAHDGRRYRIGSSIGVVPVDLRWESSAAVLQAADNCCYAAKDAGRNRVHLWVEFDAALTTRHGEMRWVNRLESAIDENRFVLFAQHIKPIAAPAAGLHCEVLLRLREDDGSMIPPGSFMPAAERFHLMVRIDKWVLQKVFAMLEADAIEFDLIDTIAVNLSGQSIGDRAFHRDLIRMLREARFDTQKLCLEITETAAITNFGDAKVFIEEVRSLGVRIALDDFGAGASSFGYLRVLPIDYLKIDGQYITGLNDPLNKAAVRCFCEVAKAVGAKTIAEFVESRDIHDALYAVGVDMTQGYLNHRPEPLAVLIPSRQPPSRKPFTVVKRH